MHSLNHDWGITRILLVEFTQNKMTALRRDKGIGEISKVKCLVSKIMAKQHDHQYDHHEFIHMGTGFL